MNATTSFAYVSGADDGSVTVLALDAAAGRLRRVQQLSIGGTGLPMALDAPRRRLFAGRRNAPETVATLAIGDDGLLRHVADGPLPASFAYLATDRDGRVLFGASYHQHVVGVMRIGDDGAVQPAHQTLPAGRHAHCIVPDASHRFVWSTSLGEDAVLHWRFDAGSGTLAPNEPPRLTLRPGSGARHLALHPEGRVAYLLNELDATLDLLRIDADRGTLAPISTHPTLPPGSQAKPWCADLQLTPDARFLYTSERTTSTIAGFALAPGGGEATPIGHWPVQQQPRAFAISADGRFLLVAGQLSHRVGLHAIDPSTGALTLVDEAEVGRNPAWVEWLDLP